MSNCRIGACRIGACRIGALVSTHTRSIWLSTKRMGL
jgi:hypothetical protein